MDDHTARLIKEMTGWESLDFDSEAIEEVRKSQESEGRELASLFHQAFVQNDAGARVLELMVKSTLLRPTITPTSSQFEAGIREGRCDWVRQILVNIELAGGLINTLEKKPDEK